MKGRVAVLSVVAILGSSLAFPNGGHAQQAPSAVQEAPPAVQQAPSAVQEAPPAAQEVPPPAKEAPLPAQEVPPAVQQAPSAGQEAPPMVQEAPPAVQQVPQAVEEAPPAAAQSYPEGLIHTVVEGDTLWDLSAKYLGTPWKWQELWERNRFVTNPHYIYPGIDIVVFPPPAKDYALSVTEPPPEEPPPPAVEEAAVPPPPAPAPPAQPMLHISPSDYVRAGEFVRRKPKAIGHIRAAEEPKVAFSEGDRVYLKLDKEIPAGQLLGVYRVRGPITAPGNGRVSGYARYLVGLIQVKGVENGEVVGVVRKSFEDLSKEDPISEEIPSYSAVPIVPGAPGLAATVISGQWENRELATWNFVFLDRGSGAGVAVGNVFRLVETGGKESSLSAREPGIRVDVGQAVVVRVSPDFSTAYVDKSYLSFPAGVTAIRGVRGAPEAR